MRGLKLKVCGMRDTTNIQQVASLKPDYMGFIFAPHSKRFAGDLLDPAALQQLPPSIKKVGVFVNAAIDELLHITRRFALQVIQLHGDEAPDTCADLKTQLPLDVELWKAFGLDEQFDFSQLAHYHGLIDRFLFDTKSPQYGGSGRSFRWALLQNLNHQTPFWLSGGIGEEHAQAVLAEAARTPHLFGVDLNSKFERAPADKSVEALGRMFARLREHSTSAPQKEG